MKLLKIFLKDYDSIFEKAGIIFNDYNLCQWEKNEDGTFSCIKNRLNSLKHSSPFIETDGCCILVCINPKQYNDKFIKRKQHSLKKGCLVKNLKCKLHYCDYLRKSPDEKIIEATQKIDSLRNEFRSRYNVLWKKIPYGLSRKYWIKFFKKIYKGRGF